MGSKNVQLNASRMSSFLNDVRVAQPDFLTVGESKDLIQRINHEKNGCRTNVDAAEIDTFITHVNSGEASIFSPTERNASSFLGGLYKHLGSLFEDSQVLKPAIARAPLPWDPGAIDVNQFPADSEYRKTAQRMAQGRAQFTATDARRFEKFLTDDERDSLDAMLGRVYRDISGKGPFNTNTLLKDSPAGIQITLNEQTYFKGGLAKESLQAEYWHTVFVAGKPNDVVALVSLENSGTRVNLLTSAHVNMQGIAKFQNLGQYAREQYGLVVIRPGTAPGQLPSIVESAAFELVPEGRI